MEFAKGFFAGRQYHCHKCGRLLTNAMLDSGHLQNCTGPPVYGRRTVDSEDRISKLEKRVAELTEVVTHQGKQIDLLNRIIESMQSGHNDR